LPDDGGPLVAVRIHRRTHAAIRDDLVAGVLAANGLGPSDEGHAELRALLSDLVPIPEGSCAA
jgi:hypothetical protein